MSTSKMTAIVAKDIHFHGSLQGSNITSHSVHSFFVPTCCGIKAIVFLVQQVSKRNKKTWSDLSKDSSCSLSASR